MNTRNTDTTSTRVKCKRSMTINPLDAASNKDKPHKRTTKSFLYSSFADYKKNKELSFKDKKNKKATKKKSLACC
jgi:hypothetical protein